MVRSSLRRLRSADVCVTHGSQPADVHANCYMRSAPLMRTQHPQTSTVCGPKPMLIGHCEQSCKWRYSCHCTSLENVITKLAMPCCPRTKSMDLSLRSPKANSKVNHVVSTHQSPPSIRCWILESVMDGQSEGPPHLLNHLWASSSCPEHGEEIMDMMTLRILNTITYESSDRSKPLKNRLSQTEPNT